MATVQTPNETQQPQDASNQRKRKLWLSGLAIHSVFAQWP